MHQPPAYDPAQDKSLQPCSKAPDRGPIASTILRQITFTRREWIANHDVSLLSAWPGLSVPPPEGRQELAERRHPAARLQRLVQGDLRGLRGANDRQPIQVLQRRHVADL